AGVRADRDAAQLRDRLCHGIPCCRDRVLADLAHLVGGDSRAVRRLCDLRSLRLARPRRHGDSGRRGRTPGSRQPRDARGGPDSGGPSMSSQVLRAPPVSYPDYRVAHATNASQASGHGAGGPAPKRIVVGYGFWIFLLSDVILFSALFASYAVLFKNTAGGMASLAVARRSLKWTQIALLITGFLGLAFVLLEAREFAGLVAHGAGPTRSAFLSSCFTLVGCHGAHVTSGLIWLATMMAQFRAKGFREDIRLRFLCFTLFWHALDIIWVAIFSLVYLVGTLPPQMLP